MTIAVLNYLTGSVDIFNIDTSDKSTENIEYLLDSIGYSLDNIYWMEVEEINLNLNVSLCHTSKDE